MFLGSTGQNHRGQADRQADGQDHVLNQADALTKKQLVLAQMWDLAAVVP